MKTVIISLLLCVSISVRSQIITDTVDRRSGWVDANGIFVYDKSGRIEITSDTMQVIRSLIKIINHKDSIIGDLWQFVSTSVDFSNNVPDYWKNVQQNPAWKEYMASLRRYGYKTVRKK